MAYDRELADRIRESLSGHAVREVGMFGGLAFLVNEKMIATADKQGDLMVRCAPARVDALLGRDGAHWPVMRGRRMSKGWIVVQSDRLESDEILTSWIQEALDYNRQVTGRGE
jgi:hypothetical protein